MKKKKTNKKIASALAMLMLSAAMLGTSTYAWFTMNKEVTVTGMEVKTTVTSNLLIAAENAEANFSTELNQAVDATLEPVSTINGIDFYYTATDNVKGNGDAINETYAKLTGDGSSDTAFQTNYGTSAIPAKGYVDYTFYLKADNANASTDKEIRLTGMNLLLEGAAVGDANAWTSAIFVHETTVNTNYTTAWASADVLSIDKMATSTGNFTANNAVGSDGAATPTIEPMALSYGATPSTTYGASGVIATVPGGTTKYYKVTVRLWLEGEDKNCTTTIYKNNLGDYSLDLKFCFDDSDAAITTIASTP